MTDEKRKNTPLGDRVFGYLLGRDLLRVVAMTNLREYSKAVERLILEKLEDLYDEFGAAHGMPMEQLQLMERIRDHTELHGQLVLLHANELGELVHEQNHKITHGETE